MSAPPRVVCFDLGGVVVRICRSFAEGCRAAGVSPTVDLGQVIDPTAFSRLVHEHQCGLLSCERFHALASELAQGRLSPDQMRRVHDAWILGEFEGVAPLMDAIHAAGIDTACLSNTNASHWRSMSGMPAFDRIRHRHASHLLGFCKPDARVYDAFERATGFRAQDILFFDDLAPNVVAASTAGWRAELVDPGRPTAPQIRAALERHGVRLVGAA